MATETKSADDIIVTKVNGQDVKWGELSKAFDQVKNREDWKGPIAAVIKAENYALYAAAVEFYTATPLVIQESSNVAAGSVYVKAEGYRAGQAN